MGQPVIAPAALSEREKSSAGARGEKLVRTPRMNSCKYHSPTLRIQTSWMQATKRPRMSMSKSSSASSRLPACPTASQPPACLLRGQLHLSAVGSRLRAAAAPGGRPHAAGGISGAGCWRGRGSTHGGGSPGPGPPPRRALRRAAALPGSAREPVRERAVLARVCARLCVPPVCVCACARGGAETARCWAGAHGCARVCECACVSVCLRGCALARSLARSLARGRGQFPAPAGGRAGVGGAHGPGAGDPAAAPAWGHPRGRAATRKKSLFGRGGGGGAVGFLGSGRAAGRRAGRCGPRERRLRGRGAWQPCGNAARRADAGAPLKNSCLGAGAQRWF